MRPPCAESEAQMSWGQSDPALQKDTRFNVVYVVVVSAYVWACACGRAHARARRMCAPVCFARAMGGGAVCGSAVS